MIEALIFVYNAESGALDRLLDSAHKVLKPSTYSCQLCQLTHGVFGEKKEWLRFRENLNIPTHFLHRDAFLKAYRSKWLPKYEFPVVLVQRNQQLEPGIDANTLKEMESLDALMRAVKQLLTSEDLISDFD